MLFGVLLEASRRCRRRIVLPELREGCAEGTGSRIGFLAECCMRAIYFDTETAGIADHQPIIQVAAVAVDEATWTELDHFETKIRFDESEAEPEALKINHYDPEVWKAKAVTPMQALRGFSAFIEPHRSLQMISKRTGQPYQVAKLIGHNAATFDGPRLKRAYQEVGLFLPADPRVRCTVQAAMWWFDAQGIQVGEKGGPKSFKLTDLCQWFSIPVDENAHDALADVRMNVALAKALRQSFGFGKAA
jgi:DNA polymerase III epsilon subunit-like protein